MFVLRVFGRKLRTLFRRESSAQTPVSYDVCLGHVTRQLKPHPCLVFFGCPLADTGVSKALTTNKMQSGPVDESDAFKESTLLPGFLEPII